MMKGLESRANKIQLADSDCGAFDHCIHVHVQTNILTAKSCVNIPQTRLIQLHHFCVCNSNLFMALILRFHCVCIYLRA